MPLPLAPGPAAAVGRPGPCAIEMLACWRQLSRRGRLLPAVRRPFPLPAAAAKQCPPRNPRGPPAGYLTQSIGMLTADASRGAFLSGFTVVVVPLMAGLCGTAKLKRSTWAAVLACLVGISLLEDSGAPASWGDFWSFLSAVLFGAQVRWVQRGAGPG